jgi:endonuclease I
MFKKLLLKISFCMAAVALQAQALLPTSWNFSNPSIGSPPAGWTLGLGTNGNLTYAFGIGDALACRFDATGEFLTINITDKPGELSYYLSPQNAGPAWGGQFDIQESDNGTVWSTLRSITTKSSTTTNFTGGKYTESNLKSTTRFIRFFYVTKLPGGVAGTPGGNMALDSVLIKAAPIAQTPTIQVSRNNKIIANNSQNVVGNNDLFSFKVKNVGLLDTLIINNADFTGSNAGSFTILNTFPIRVASNDSTTINCTLNTSGNGSRLAAINIYNNDADKPKFTINLYGIAGSLATEPLFTPVSLTISNVTAFGMNVSLADTSTLTENYIVLRKSGAITETPLDGQTYLRGDYIGGTQVAYIGKIGTFKPVYILANTNYSYAAFAFNGPASYENYLTSSSANGTANSLFGNAGNYYSTVSAPGTTNFLTTLSAKVNPHDTIFYSNYIPTVINNFLTRDTAAGKKVVNCVYTGLAYIYSEPFVWNANNSTGILSREHTRAQSTMPSNNSTQNPSWPNAGSTNRELPEFNDLHNLFPTHQTLANAPRSNNPFGECVTVTSTSPSGFGKLGKDLNGNTVYEPKNEQKGDLARAMFYMCVSYNGINGNIWTLPTDQNLAVLMKWHQQDPPSAEEIARHEYIAFTQKNRNPFIDNPNWANLINFKTMTLITSKILAVNTPNGGESLKAGSSTNINWTASNLTTKVKLEYTTNGTDFILIDSVNASPAVYTWTVPSVSTTTAKIKVSATDNSISDLSKANFSINIPILKLLTPLSTDIWTGNETKAITWQSAFVDSIIVDLKDGATLLFSAREAANKVTISVAVPNINTTNAKVFITEINGALKDSSATFNIQKSVGVNEALNFSFIVYPNPSNGTIYFNSNINLQNSNFEIYDITGKLFISDSFSKTNMVTIASKGIYILKANINGKILIKKVVVE